MVIVKMAVVKNSVPIKFFILAWPQESRNGYQQLYMLQAKPKESKSAHERVKKTLIMQYRRHFNAKPLCLRSPEDWCARQITAKCALPERFSACKECRQRDHMVPRLALKGQVKNRGTHFVRSAGRS